MATLISFFNLLCACMEVFAFVTCLFEVLRKYILGLNNSLFKLTLALPVYHISALLLRYAFL